MRLLDAALKLRETRAPSSPMSASVTVGKEGGWFSTGATGRVDLGRRTALRRLLWELTLQRERAPGQGVPLERLFEAAWPNVQIRPDSQAARVYVAIGTLRKLGLSPVLLRQDDGYLLDPAVFLSVAPD